MTAHQPREAGDIGIDIDDDANPYNATAAFTYDGFSDDYEVVVQVVGNTERTNLMRLAAGVDDAVDSAIACHADAEDRGAYDHTYGPTDEDDAEDDA